MAIDMKIINLLKKCLETQDFGEVLTEYAGIDYYSEEWIGNTTYDVDIMFDGGKIFLMDESWGVIYGEASATCTCITHLVRIRFAEDIENQVNRYIESKMLEI